MVTTLLCPVERILMGRDFGVNILTFPQVTAVFYYEVQNPAKFKNSIFCKIGTELSLLIYVLHPAVWHTTEAVYAKLQMDTSVAALYLMPLIVVGISMGCATLLKSIEKKVTGGKIKHD